MSSIMSLRATAAFALLTFLTISAQAGGGYGGSFKDDPVYSPRFDWSGGYAGLHVGGAWGDSDWTWRGGTGAVTDRLTGGTCGTPPGGAAAGCSPGHDVSGWLAGGQVGWLLHSGSIVIGGELSLSGGEIDGSSQSIVGAADDTFTTETNLLVSAAVRVGIAMDRALISLKGGYAGADIQSTVSDGTAPAVGIGSVDEWHNGFIIGAGLDYAVTNNIIFGIDYSYYALESRRHSRAFNGAGGTVDDSVDLDMHSITARLNYKF